MSPLEALERDDDALGLGQREAGRVPAAWWLAVGAHELPQLVAESLARRSGLGVEVDPAPREEQPAGDSRSRGRKRK